MHIRYTCFRKIDIIHRLKHYFLIGCTAAWCYGQSDADLLVYCQASLLLANPIWVYKLVITAYVAIPSKSMWPFFTTSFQALCSRYRKWTMESIYSEPSCGGQALPFAYLSFVSYWVTAQFRSRPRTVSVSYALFQLSLPISGHFGPPILKLPDPRPGTQCP